MLSSVFATLAVVLISALPAIKATPFDTVFEISTEYRTEGFCKLAFGADAQIGLYDPGDGSVPFCSCYTAATGRPLSSYTLCSGGDGAACFQNIVYSDANPGGVETDVCTMCDDGLCTSQVVTDLQYETACLGDDTLFAVNGGFCGCGTSDDYINNQGYTADQLSECKPIDNAYAYCSQEGVITPFIGSTVKAACAIACNPGYVLGATGCTLQASAVPKVKRREEEEKRKRAIF